MRRWFMPSMIVMLTLGVLLTSFAQVEGQAPGGALCEQARATGHLPGYEVSDGSRGGRGNQVLLGTDGPDVLSGGGGNDILCGFGGDDRLVGGSGNDILVGGEGADDLRGNSGNDTFVVDVDDSRVRGGSGNDRTQVVTTPQGSIFISVDFKTLRQCDFFVHLEQFAPDTAYDVELTAFDQSGTSLGSETKSGLTDGDGSAVKKFDSEDVAGGVFRASVEAKVTADGQEITAELKITNSRGCR